MSATEVPLWFPVLLIVVSWFVLTIILGSFWGVFLHKHIDRWFERRIENGQRKIREKYGNFDPSAPPDPSVTDST